MISPTLFTVTGHVKPKEIVFIVDGQQECFCGAPPDWITVEEYANMRRETQKRRQMLDELASSAEQLAEQLLKFAENLRNMEC